MDRVGVEESTIDLRELSSRAWSRRWWIVASVIVVSAPFAAFAFMATPMYRAVTVMVPTGSERSNLSGGLGSALAQVGGLASLAGINVGSGDSGTEEAIAVLRSRQFTERFISDLELLPVLFASQWDGAAGRWKGESKDEPTPAKAFKYFDSQIRQITRDRQTGLVSVQIEWRDREAAAAWANELVVRLNNEMRGRAIEKARASLTFLERELGTTALVGTRDAINRLIESQIRERMLANVSPEFAFRVVDLALPPDADDPIKPNKLLLLVAGVVVGFIVGLLLVVVVDPSAVRKTGSVI